MINFKNMTNRLFCFFFFLSIVTCLSCFGQQRSATQVFIITPSISSPRIEFGALKLSQVLKNAGYEVKLQKNYPTSVTRSVVIRTTSNADARNTTSSSRPATKQSAKEGFSILSSNDREIIIEGTDPSGALYGCLELADQVRSTGKLPANISFNDRPQMVLRGACIGLQKPTYLPGRHVYEYPYTPETFPWFYDKPFG